MTQKLSQWRDDVPEPHSGRDLMDRMNAPFAIARSLDLLGLASWTHVLLVWLGHYEGFEQRLQPVQDPLLAVRDLLAGYVTRSQRMDTGTIVGDLCQLEVLHHRAAWVHRAQRTRRNWMPLQEPWLAFLAQGETGEELRVWWSPDIWPSEELVRRFLISGYLRLDQQRRR